MTLDTFTVRILLFATYRELLGVSHLDLEVSPGITASEVYDLLANREPRMAALRRFTTFAVNREVVGGERVLQENDEVALLQPVSGGTND